MTRVIYLYFPFQITRDEWTQFCNENGIEFSPDTIGGNVFYTQTPDKIEICFGYPAYDSGIDGGENGIQPPLLADTISVSSAVMGSLEQVIAVAALISKRWDGGWWAADPDLEEIIRSETFSG